MVDEVRSKEAGFFPCSGIHDQGTGNKSDKRRLSSEPLSPRMWTGTTGRTTRLLTPSPRRDILQLHMTLSKPLSSIIVQMCTEKMGLKWFLSQRKCRMSQVPTVNAGEVIRQFDTSFWRTPCPKASEEKFGMKERQDQQGWTYGKF
jgi:hypothetical protein